MVAAPPTKSAELDSPLSSSGALQGPSVRTLLLSNRDMNSGHGKPRGLSLQEGGHSRDEVTLGGSCVAISGAF
jgi:hypothetical protein